MPVHLSFWCFITLSSHCVIQYHQHDQATVSVIQYVLAGKQGGEQLLDGGCAGGAAE